ncbi:MAG: cation:proton antiporter [bacterium]|nr:cation:proton antiporter [bacterium]
MNFNLETVFIIQSLIIIVLPFILWNTKIIRSFVPLVVIQIFVGILLGPSILGRISQSSYNLLFPENSLMILNGLYWLALILLGFQTGLHIDPDEITKKGTKYVIVSASSLIVPMFAGALIAAKLYSPQFIGPNATRFSFIAGMAIAAGVTALPVLSVILYELELISKNIGIKSLAYAAANDLFLWLSILILNVISSGNSCNIIFERLIIVIAFLILSFFAVKKFLTVLLDKGFLSKEVKNKDLVIILFFVLIYAFIGEIIGISYLVGAFIFGVIFPKSVSKNIKDKLEQFLFVILLPFLFILTGLKTSCDITNYRFWVLFIIMTIVISGANIIGAALPEKYFGTSLKESLQIGVLMQTKGLMEVVFLNMLLNQGIINSTTFSAMLFVAMATTALTKPMLMLLDKTKLK